MTQIPGPSSPASWLGQALKSKREEIAILLRKLKVFGTSESMKPGVFEKFSGTLDQISQEKEKEERILRHIADIEAEHKWRREKNALDEIKPKPEQIPLSGPDIEEKPKSRLSLFWLWVLMHLLSNKKDFNHK
jgi:hypothetical protein